MAKQKRSNDWGFPRWRSYGGERAAAPGVLARALAGFQGEDVFAFRGRLAGLGRAHADVDELRPVLEAFGHGREYEAEKTAFKD